jgi:hypothetical protein
MASKVPDAPNPKRGRPCMASTKPRAVPKPKRASTVPPDAPNPKRGRPRMASSSATESPPTASTHVDCSVDCDLPPLPVAATPVSTSGGVEQLLQQLVAAISHPAAAAPVSTSGGVEQLLQQLVAAISHPAAAAPVSMSGGREQLLTPLCGQGQLPGLFCMSGRHMIMPSYDVYDDQRYADIISDQQFASPYVANRGYDGRPRYVGIRPAAPSHGAYHFY